MTSETNRREQKLTVKDLTTVGVSSVIILIYISLSGGPFTTFPAPILYFLIGTVLLAGPVYLLLVAKVPKLGPIFIVGLVMVIFCYTTGVYTNMNIDCLAGDILAGLVARTGRYRNIKINTLFYTVFCLGGTGFCLAYLINSQAQVSRMLEKGTPQEYLDIVATTVSHWILISMLADTVLVALLSGFVGSRLLKKQFEKARITA